MGKVVLSVKNVSKKFGERVAVENVSFEISEGEIFGLLGPNGAGKTTTLRMITGLAKPSYGTISICGWSVNDNFEKAIINIGAIIENPSMYNNFTGLENLRYYAGLYGNVTKKRIVDVVNLVGLNDRIKDKIKNYSLGMKQRIGIAQALLHSPKLLILDEPTNGLDPSGIIDMRGFLKEIATKEGIAILVSSHILAEMELMCDTIGIMNGGKLENVKSVSSIKSLKENAASKIKITVNFPNYAGKLILSKFSPQTITINKNTLNVSLDKDCIPEIVSILVSNGILIYEIGAVTKSLEDIFMETINKRALGAPKD